MFAITILISFFAFALLAMLFWVIFSRAFEGQSRSTMFFVGAAISTVLGIVGLVLKNKMAFTLLIVAALWFAMAIKLRVGKQG